MTRGRGTIFCSIVSLSFLLALPAAAREVSIRLLATTDLHGNIFPWDYYAGEPVQRGLAKLASIIAAERNPNTLLIDCGDTIQGVPLEGVYQSWVLHGRLPLNLTAPAGYAVDPMMLAMNALKYDVMTVGNHEWNFGLKNLNQARAAAQFPWISASIETTPGSKAKPFQPWIVKTIAGVKIAVIGITTPGETTWERPANYAGYRFLQGKEAAAKAVAEVRRTEHPDLVIVAAHAGVDRDLKTGKLSALDSLPGENMVYQIATEVPGIDSIVFGHTHAEVPEARVGNVLLMQPRNWGISLGEMNFTLEDTPDGHWRLVSDSSRTIPVTDKVPVDASIAKIGQLYHDTAERFLNAPVAQSPVEMDGAVAKIRDTPMIDMVHEVERHYAQADVSFASIFNARLKIPKGQVTVRQIAGLYLYDNTLYAIEGTGKTVHDALENAARYFLTCTGDCSTGPLINRNIIAYNYDMASGVEYEIDLRQPEGSRIRNLRWKGKPLADDEKLRIALNNYRAGGAAGYTMFKDAKIVWRSTEEIRDLLIEYYMEHKILPAKAAGNWKIVPEAAEQELEREALRLGRAPALQ